MGDQGPSDCSITGSLACTVPRVFVGVLVVLGGDPKRVFWVVPCMSMHLTMKFEVSGVGAVAPA